MVSAQFCAVDQDKIVPFRCLLAEELQNEDNDEIVLLEDGEVDVGDLAALIWA